jgi:hypothetical protein
MLSIVNSKVAPADTKPNELEFFTSKIYDKGAKIFFKSYRFESFLIILDKHTSDFLRTANAVLLDNAKSKIASERDVRAGGIIEASIDKAND